MMHRSGLVLLLVAAILFGLMAMGIVVQGHAPQPDVLPQPDVQWEYKTICVPGPFTDAAQTLNEYGKRGWEVVDWEDTGFKHYLLKRQTPN